MRSFALVCLFGLVALATAQRIDVLGGRRTRNGPLIKIAATRGDDALVKAQIGDVDAAILGAIIRPSNRPSKRSGPLVKFAAPRREDGDALVQAKIGNVEATILPFSGSSARASRRQNLKAAVKNVGKVLKNIRDSRKTQPRIEEPVKIETPAVQEEPILELPVGEEPIVELPVEEEPTLELPAVETPVEETPKAPETPTDPETPKAPETPTDTETPKAPETPTDPETPKAPETPTDPETPKAPETPTAPRPGCGGGGRRDRHGRRNGHGRGRGGRWGRRGGRDYGRRSHRGNGRGRRHH